MKKTAGVQPDSGSESEEDMEESQSQPEESTDLMSSREAVLAK